MARTLEQLQKQYNKAASDKRRGMMPGRPGRGPARFDPKQRPKISKDTIKRLLSYLSSYKGRLVLVLFFMLFSTVAAIVGTSAVARIIDALTPNADGTPKSFSSPTVNPTNSFIPNTPSPTGINPTTAIRKNPSDPKISSALSAFPFATSAWAR